MRILQKRTIIKRKDRHDKSHSEGTTCSILPTSLSLIPRPEMSQGRGDGLYDSRVSCIITEWKAGAQRHGKSVYFM
jgi:hypothetical protein